MRIIMLLLINYAHFSKMCKNYASTFYFKFSKNISITMQQTNKWQAHLPFLHLEKYLRVHNLFSENYKN